MKVSVFSSRQIFKLFILILLFAISYPAAKSQEIGEWIGYGYTTKQIISPSNSETYRLRYKILSLAPDYTVGVTGGRNTQDLFASITIPDKVICAKYPDITWTVTEVNSNGFECMWTMLEKISLPNTITKIGDEAFDRCSKLTTINIPASVTEIGERAFFQDSQINHKIDLSNVESIGSYAFWGCYNIRELILGDKLITIPENAFAPLSNVTKVSFGNSIQTIGSYAFAGIGLKNVVLPSSVITLSDKAFTQSSMERVELSSSLSSIGSACFAECDELMEIVSPRTSPPTIKKEDAFDQTTYQNAILYVPLESVSRYKSATYWKNFYKISDLKFKDCKIYSDNFEIQDGESVTQPVKFSNGEDALISKISFNLAIPEGLGIEDISLTENAISQGFQLTRSNTDIKNYTISCSATSPVSSSQISEILSIRYKAEGSIFGEKEIKFANITVTCENQDNNIGDWFTQVNIKPILVSSIIITPSSIDINIDQTVEFTAEIQPENATLKEIDWSVDNEDISLNVIENTKVQITGKNLGASKLIAKAKDEGNVTTIASINIVPIEIQSIDIIIPSEPIRVGSKFELQAKVIPEDIPDLTYTWGKVSGNYLYSPNSDNNYIAVQPGKETVRLTVSNGVTNKIFTKEITVENAFLTFPESLDFNQGQEVSVPLSLSGVDQNLQYYDIGFNIELPKGMTLKEVKTLTNLEFFTYNSGKNPTNGNNQYYIAGTTSNYSDINIITNFVSLVLDITKETEVGNNQIRFSNVLINTIASAEFIYLVNDNEIDITINQAISAPEFKMDDFEIRPGEIKQIPVSLTIEEDIKDIFEYGAIKFTVNCPEGLTVTDAKLNSDLTAKGFSIPMLVEGKNVMVYAQGAGAGSANVLDDFVTLSVKADEYAVPTNNAQLTLSECMVVLPAASTELKSEDITVSVKILEIPVSAITIEAQYEGRCSHEHLRVSEKISFRAEVSPANATNKNVTWTVENPSVASFTDGILTAIGTGTTNVKATAGTVTATYSITVLETIPGDANGNGTVNVADIVTSVNYIVGTKHENFCLVNANVKKSDDEKEGFEIDSDDITETVNITFANMGSGSKGMTSKIGAYYPGYLKIGDFPGNSQRVEIPVSLEYPESAVAMLTALSLPDGMDILEIKAGDALADHSIAYGITDNNILRVMVYSLSNSRFNAEANSIFSIVVSTDHVTGDIALHYGSTSNETSRKFILESEGGYVNDESSVSSVVDPDALQIKTGEGFVEISGGKGEIVRLLTIDGKNLRNITIQNASQRINLDKGLYILCIKDEAIKINVR